MARFEYRMDAEKQRKAKEIIKRETGLSPSKYIDNLLTDIANTGRLPGADTFENKIGIMRIVDENKNRNAIFSVTMMNTNDTLKKTMNVIENYDGKNPELIAQLYGPLVQLGNDMRKNFTWWQTVTEYDSRRLIDECNKN
jgi:antitoxin component of RelBE/YafQ-DinJ toxin-antitoxin module